MKIYESVEEFGRDEKNIREGDSVIIKSYWGGYFTYHIGEGGELKDVGELEETLEEFLQNFRENQE